MSKITHYKEELNRTIEWLKFAEQKLAFLWVYYWLWTTFILANNSKILNVFVEPCSLKIIPLLWFFTSMFLGIWFLFYVVFPSLKNHSTNNSFFFFWHTAKMKVLDYVNQMKALTDNEIENQLLEQIHTNSVIANEKMTNIKRSSYCLFVNLIFLLISIFLI